MEFRERQSGRDLSLPNRNAQRCAIQLLIELKTKRSPVQVPEPPGPEIEDGDVVAPKA